jgi:hypothetical protein
LKKTPIVCAENWQKSQKIVIITSTPDEFEKNNRKCGATNFLSKSIHNLPRGKCSPKIWAIVVIKKTRIKKTIILDAKISTILSPCRAGILTENMFLTIRI